MTPKSSQTDLSIKSYDKDSAKNGLPSAAAKLTPNLTKTTTIKIGMFSNLSSNTYMP
jgi:hypothetical protein